MAAVEADEPAGAYYHGGAGWMGVGDYVLPRNLTGDPGARADAEICAADLSNRFIATELLAHAMRMLFSACDLPIARVLAAKHWEQVLAPAVGNGA